MAEPIFKPGSIIVTQHGDSVGITDAPDGLFSADRDSADASESVADGDSIRACANCHRTTSTTGDANFCANCGRAFNSSDSPPFSGFNMDSPDNPGTDGFTGRKRAGGAIGKARPAGSERPGGLAWAVRRTLEQINTAPARASRNGDAIVHPNTCGHGYSHPHCDTAAR